MSSRFKLNNELRKLVESRLKGTIKGIEETLKKIFESQEITLVDLKKTIQDLEESFNIFSQKWNLQILYILFLRDPIGFNEFKKILGVNSRTLSDKLKNLKKYNYIKRRIQEGPPIRIQYYITQQGRDVILLALPLIYYSSSKIKE